MAHSYNYKRTQIRGRVINLTEHSVSAYGWDGSIFKFPPSPAPEHYDPDTYYIVDNPYCGTISKNLVVATNGGVGRNGVQVAQLVLIANPAVRVIPVIGDP